MKILFGGAFNPPTKAHKQIALRVLEYFPDSTVVFLPANDYYHKQQLIPFVHRYNMVKLMMEGIDNVEVDDYENTVSEYTGTYYTLKHFKDYYFIIGDDSLMNLPNWIESKKLIEENKFIVVPRSDVNIDDILNSDELLKQNKDHFKIIPFNKMDVSSHQYRQSKESKYLEKEVLDYINKNNLYKE